MKYEWPAWAGKPAHANEIFFDFEGVKCAFLFFEEIKVIDDSCGLINATGEPGFVHG